MSLEMVQSKNGKWPNAAEDRIGIVPYNPSWPSMYEKEVAAIREVVSNDVRFTPVHVGSTAVPGLSAKPIIDIMLLVPEHSQWSPLVRPLESLGYVFWNDNPNPDRMFFVKGMPPFGTGRTHHVHVRQHDDVEEAVAFRDFLRSHPATATRYENIKHELAGNFETDRDAYTAAKSAVVREILSRVRAG